MRESMKKACEDGMMVGQDRPFAWIQSTHIANLEQTEVFMCRLSKTKMHSDFVPLYTRPDDKLRKAVESFLAVSDEGLENGKFSQALINLRLALL